MKRRPNVSVFTQSLFILLLAMSVNPSASAAQVTIPFTGLVKSLTGSLWGYFLIDEVAPTGQFSFSTDETQASLTDTVGTVYYDSRYQFSGTPNGISLTYPQISFPPSTTDYSYNSAGNIEVRVTNNRVIDQAASTALAGLVVPGTYDWIDLRWTDIGLAWGSGLDLQTWQLSIYGDTNWFTDGTLIPDALPTSYTLYLYASHDDNVGNHIGDMLAANYSTSGGVSAVPVPPAIWLLASGIAGLGLTARRRQAA